MRTVIFACSFLALPLTAHPDPMAELHRAVLAGNYIEVEQLLKSSKVNVNAQNSDGQTALHIATISDTYVDDVSIMLEVLFAYGADPYVKDNKGETAYDYAKYVDQPEMCVTAAYLLKGMVGINGKDARGYTPLDWVVCWAEYSGDNDIMQQLIDEGADIRQVGRYNPLSLALGVMNDVELFMALAAEEGGIEEVVKKYGSTYLVMAAFYKHEGVVKLMLDHGADPNGRAEGYPTDIEDRTTVMAAVINSYHNAEKKRAAQRIVETLLTYGADVNVTTADGLTALVAAVSWLHEEVVKILLAHGADVNAGSSSYHSTALINAARRGNVSLVKLLLAHGADPHLADKRGNTPLKAAKFSGTKEVVEILLQAMQEN